jgi:hypothetical protein
MVSYLLLALGLALILLNVVDAVLTRIGVRRGHPELVPGTKALIEKLGLDKAMIFKVLSLTLVVILVIIFGGVISVFEIMVSVVFVFLVIFYSYTVVHDCIELLKSNH